MDAEKIAAGLSPSLREVVLAGPNAYWPRAMQALKRRGICPVPIIYCWNELGLAVRAIIEREMKGES